MIRVILPIFQVEFWTEFARTGDPNGPKTRDIIQWDPVSNDENPMKIKCLNLSRELTFVEWPEIERMRFWDQLYEQRKRELSTKH